MTAVDAVRPCGALYVAGFVGRSVAGLKRYRFAASEPACYGIVRAGVGYFSIGAWSTLGGISTLWPLFIANQMLAGMALMLLCRVVLFKNEASALCVECAGANGCFDLYADGGLAESVCRIRKSASGHCQ